MVSNIYKKNKTRPNVRILFFDFIFLCCMVDINKVICNYIAEEWISSYKSNRKFAIDHNIDEKTVRKILQKSGYRIPVRTLQKICEAREIKISEFFLAISA